MNVLAAAEPQEIRMPDINRTPCWITSGDARLSAWLHQPNTAGVSRRGAVVICNPVGHELIHAQRSVRQLADKLAKAGFSVLRFDYRGTGDSSGEQLQAGIVTQWCDDASRAIEFVKTTCNTEQVAVIGVRGGALFAAEAIAGLKNPGPFILFDALGTGKRQVRELKANSRLAYFESTPELLQAVGFPYTAAMQDELRKLDAAASLEDVVTDVLMITRWEYPDKKLQGALAGHGERLQTMEFGQLEEMLIEPHKTRVPTDAIEAMRDWLLERELPAAEAAVAADDWRRLLPAPQDQVIETPLEIEPSGMFGILAEPADGSGRARPVVLLGNAGSIYHIGPNRLYVLLARKLAEAGLPSIRYDLANIGDGMKYPHDEPNVPYPDDAVERISDVIRYVTEELSFPGAILTGFCSGATQAFHAALAQPAEVSLNEIIMVNPKVFYAEQAGIDPENQVMRRTSYYNRALRDPERWKRMLKGDIDFAELRSFLARRTRLVAARIVNRAKSMVGKGEVARLGKDLQQYMQSGRGLSFFFSSRDPGLTVLRESSGGVARKLIDGGRVKVTMIEDGDHTLIKKECREDFVEKFVSQVVRSLDRRAAS